MKTFHLVTTSTHYLVSINRDPGNLAVVIALATMGLISNDEALIDAALSEILALPVEERHTRDPNGDVNDLLVKHHLANVSLSPREMQVNL